MCTVCVVFNPHTLVCAKQNQMHIFGPSHSPLSNRYSSPSLVGIIQSTDTFLYSIFLGIILPLTLNCSFIAPFSNTFNNTYISLYKI